LNLCLQKGHKFESAWYSPWQLEHLKVCGHGSPFFVSRHRGLIFVLALQHQPNLQWFSDLWGLLYLMHLESWILHKNIEWPYFQQFFLLQYSGIHVSISNGHNILSNIEVLVNKALSPATALDIPNINLNDRYVGFRWYLDNL